MKSRVNWIMNSPNINKIYHNLKKNKQYLIIQFKIDYYNQLNNKMKN